MYARSYMRAEWPAAALFALAPFFAYAQADDADAVVVTASRTEQRIRDAIPHTTVLTRQDIRDSQAVDLPTILRREASIEISQNGGLGGNASLFMRGGRSAQTLVLIDGVRLEDSGFGTTPIQHLMLDDIERIGVVQLAKNYRAGSELLGDEQGCQNGHGLGFEVLEQDDFTQYIGKGRHKRDRLFCGC